MFRNVFRCRRDRHIQRNIGKLVCCFCEDDLHRIHTYNNDNRMNDTIEVPYCFSGRYMNWYGNKHDKLLVTIILCAAMTMYARAAFLDGTYFGVVAEVKIFFFFNMLLCILLANVWTLRFVRYEVTSIFMKNIMDKNTVFNLIYSENILVHISSYLKTLFKPENHLWRSCDPTVYYKCRPSSLRILHLKAQ